ncbi:putative amino acid permease [Aspergillus foveolatus]|uniref:putative amino acid permease n=1 Tax=Aspergillus foveolatus TaxID=210207 RepID=UPI003CCD925F
MSKSVRKLSVDSLRRLETPQTGTVQNAYSSVLPRNRGLATILFMSLSIAAVPYGTGSALMNAVYGGGQLSMFVGLLVVCILDGCIAVSLAELASRYPSSSGVYHWYYCLAKGRKSIRFLSFITGLATIAIYHPSFEIAPWQLVLVFYALCLVTFLICATGDRRLPLIDTLAAASTLLACMVVAITLSATAKTGRHSASYGLGHSETGLSGWGDFSFFIGLLPPAYTLSALGMVTSMSEECVDAEVQMPKAMVLVPVISGAASAPERPYGQALPYIFTLVTGSSGGALGLMFLVLLVTLTCSIRITTATAPCTWAMSRDNAIPFSGLWSKTIWDRPLPALRLVTMLEMLLGLIYLGNTSAFTAFASVGVIALAVAYAVPIAISIANGRREVLAARWNAGKVAGAAANWLALIWILFELVLFSMPTALPVTEVSMNYTSVVFAGCIAINVVWYAVYGRISKGLLKRSL